MKNNNTDLASFETSYHNFDAQVASRATLINQNNSWGSIAQGIIDSADGYGSEAISFGALLKAVDVNKEKSCDPSAPKYIRLLEIGAEGKRRQYGGAAGLSPRPALDLVLRRLTLKAIVENHPDRDLLDEWREVTIARMGEIEDADILDFWATTIFGVELECHQAKTPEAVELWCEFGLEFLALYCTLCEGDVSLKVAGVKRALSYLSDNYFDRKPDPSVQKRFGANHHAKLRLAEGLLGRQPVLA